MLLTLAALAVAAPTLIAASETLIDPAYWSYVFVRSGIATRLAPISIDASVFTNRSAESVFGGKDDVEFVHGEPDEWSIHTYDKFLSRPMASVMPDSCVYVEATNKRLFHNWERSEILQFTGVTEPRLMRALGEQAEQDLMPETCVHFHSDVEHLFPDSDLRSQDVVVPQLMRAMSEE